MSKVNEQRLAEFKFDLKCSSITQCEVKVNPFYSYKVVGMTMDDGEQIEITDKGFVPSFDQDKADSEMIIAYHDVNRDIKMAGTINFHDMTISIVGEGFDTVTIEAKEMEVSSPDVLED